MGIPSTMSLDGMMRVAIDVSMYLDGGIIVLQIGDDTAGKRLTDLVMELIESRELVDFTIPMADLKAIDEVRRELEVVADLIGQRVELERDRARLRGG